MTPVPPTPPTPPPDGTPPSAAAAGTWGALVGLVGATAAAMVMVFLPPQEGTVLFGHRDPVGVITACTGHTGNDVVLGRPYTRAQCDAWLASDLVIHAKALKRCIKRELKPHETAALLSLMFNVGPGRAGVKDGLCELKRGGPSTIARASNAGDMVTACASISDWTGARGINCALPEHTRRCGGIVTRRAAERAMCEGRLIPA